MSQPKPQSQPEPRPETTVFRKGYADQYDLLYSDKNYKAECDMIEEVFRRYGNGEIKTILDLGCGTGNHAIPLAQRGYQVTGVDISQDMLSIARSKADDLFEKDLTRQTKETKKTREAGIIKPIFLEGDVRSLNLNKTFDAVLMMFAVLGYQLTNEDVLAALKTVRQHLKPAGLFVCDVWFGPAVLKIRPGDKIREIPTAGGKVIRMASGALDVRRHLCEVNYRLLQIAGDRVVNSSDETHRMRYFFPMEFELMFSCNEMKLENLTAFPDLEKPANETTWNVLGIGKAV